MLYSRVAVVTTVLLMLGVGCTVASRQPFDGILPVQNPLSADAEVTDPLKSPPVPVPDSGVPAPVPTPTPTPTPVPDPIPDTADAGPSDAGPAQDAMPDAVTACNGRGGNFVYRSQNIQYNVPITPACTATGITLSLGATCAPQLNYMTVNGSKSVSFLGQSTVGSKLVADFAINWNGAPPTVAAVKATFNDLGLGSCSIDVILN